MSSSGEPALGGGFSECSPFLSPSNSKGLSRCWGAFVAFLANFAGILFVFVFFDDFGEWTKLFRLPSDDENSGTLEESGELERISGGRDLLDFPDVFKLFILGGGGAGGKLSASSSC